MSHVPRLQLRTEPVLLPRARAHKGKGKKRGPHTSNSSATSDATNNSTPTNASQDADEDDDDDGQDDTAGGGDDEDGGISAGEHSEGNESEAETPFDRSVVSTRHPSMAGLEDYDREHGLERERAFTAQLSQDDALPPVTVTSTFYRIVFAFQAKNPNELTVQVSTPAVKGRHTVTHVALVCGSDLPFLCARFV